MNLSTREMKKVPHDSSLTHVAGESVFVDDRPPVAGELHVGVVYSPHAHAKIRAIEPSTALAVSGVVGVYTAKDLAHNRWGTIFQDQPILAEDTVNYVGEPVALVAAETKAAMEQGRRALRVEYEALDEPVLTIEEARKRGWIIGPVRKIGTGDAEAALKKAPHVLEGVIRMKGQDHFYLESQASIAYPGENAQIEIHSSSQHPTEVQHLVAHALGLSYHEVVCVVKRMGGAFGGKESQAAPFAAMAALVAHRTKRAARLILNKDDDMQITGKRNPFENHYRVGFDDDGRILALKADLYSDAGAYADLSTSIMERAMLHSDNAYYLPNAEITGTVCRTHTASNTAFRGFGGPKGVAMIENIIEEIAHALGKDALDVREVNCYGKTERNVTPYGQRVTEGVLPDLFAELEKTCDYRRRRQEITQHNRTSRETLRGLALTAVKFGISFTTRFLNQGSALVNVHLDGTIQVSTGATEMGQGVNTKIAQVVAECFGIDASHVKVMPTSTEKNHNTSPTAASSGSDINAAAALAASEKIVERLKAFFVALQDQPKEFWGRKAAGAGIAPEVVLDLSRAHDDVVFEDGFVFDRRKPKEKVEFTTLLEEAYLNRVSLGEHGYFRYPGIHFNKETGKGEPFFYFTNGVAASEVSIDRFTGELKVLRTDILMDLGRPINEGIDLGQVTGAFVQGMGWVTTENLFYSEKGALLSHSPSTYKIPSVQDIPRVFNARLIPNDRNTKNVRGSKAVGEPPLLLGISVWAAAKDALKSLAGGGEIPRFGIPATQEVLLLEMERLKRGPDLGRSVRKSSVK